MELHFLLITPPLNSSTEALSIYLNVAHLFSFPLTSELGHQGQTQQHYVSNEVKVKCLNSLRRKLQQHRSRRENQQSPSFSCQSALFWKCGWMLCMYYQGQLHSRAVHLCCCREEEAITWTMNDRWWCAAYVYLAVKTFCWSQEFISVNNWGNNLPQTWNVC